MFATNSNRIRVAINRIFTIAIVLLFASAAFAKNPKLTDDLEAVDANTTVNVIVRYKVAPQDTHVAKAKKYGAKMKFKHNRSRAVSYKIKRSQLEKLLADDTNIAMITPDRPIKSMNDFTSATVGANIAHNLGFDGQGIGVAIIDSGVMDHPDLHNYKKDQKNAGDVNRVVYSESFVENAVNANDKNGHGTHVTGIVAGNGNSSTCNTCTDPIVGVAPGVNIINLQVLDAQGNGSDSQTIAAIDRAIELKDKYNIRVINMSLGRPVYESYQTDPLCQAVEAAWKSGIVVVVSAGNLGRNLNTNGYGTITAPGNDPYVITVGAMKADGTDTRSDDAIASYSSKGPSLVDHVVKPDIVAPGNKVESLFVPNSTLANLEADAIVPVSEYNSTGAGQPAYFRMSGTSMAAPVVAGAAALLIEKNPDLTPDQVKAQLMKSATRDFPATTTVMDPTNGNSFVSNYDVFTVGAGYLDIQNALENMDAVPVAAVGSAQSPSVKHDDLTGTMTLSQVQGSVFDATTAATVYGPQGVSAEGIIWGSLGVSSEASTAIWSEGIIWGSAGTSAEGIIWGSLGAEGIIWGSLSSEGIIWGSVNGILGE